jgi:hypothetical protein
MCAVMCCTTTAHPVQGRSHPYETTHLVLQRQLLVGIIGIGLLLSAGFAMALEVGDQAPDFSLPSTTGGEISLSQFQGKKLVLLEFYGADFAPV